MNYIQLSKGRATGRGFENLSQERPATHNLLANLYLIGKLTLDIIKAELQTI